MALFSGWSNGKDIIKKRGKRKDDAIDGCVHMNWESGANICEVVSILFLRVSAAILEESLMVSLIRCITASMHTVCSFLG